MNWPNDADGDVLRNLEKQDFDFDKVWEIDFNIDFASWPLSLEAQQGIKSIYPNCVFEEPDDEDIEEGNTSGYVRLTVKSQLTYDLVIRMQAQISQDARPFGGRCESWGLMH